MAKARIYTGTGDDGTTGLIGRTRVSKSDPRIEAYGAVDELNALLGLVVAHGAGELDEATLSGLRDVQGDLFCIGAVLASPEGAVPGCEVPAEQVRKLERWIDRVEQGLEPLRSFILPGGTRLAAWLHLARTVCRRAERRVVALAERAAVPVVVIQYLNRLSDLLFVLARDANARAGQCEVRWQRPAADAEKSA